MAKIKAVIKSPEKKPYVTWISNTLENLQKIVGGCIETVTAADDVVIICDEEGRLKRKDFNCMICGVGFVGTIIICGISGDGFGNILIEFSDVKKLFPKLF
ncbi:MAG: DUF3846 domain-containing protein [Clostridia bacterium]|nr:DUF3846 domain-containing protein [Clostridia bacterium]